MSYVEAFTSPIFTQADVGCHADHSFGWDHVRDVLADLVQCVHDSGRRSAWTDDCPLARKLRGPSPDDYGDEDEALEILQGATADGLVWVIDQDLLLTTSEA